MGSMLKGFVPYDGMMVCIWWHHLMYLPRVLFPTKARTIRELTGWGVIMTNCAFYS